MTAADLVKNMQARIDKARKNGRVELHLSLDVAEVLVKLAYLGTSVHAQHKAALAKLGDALDRGDALVKIEQETGR